MAEDSRAVRMLQPSRPGAFRSTAQCADRSEFLRGPLHEIQCGIQRVEAAVAILALGSVPRMLSTAVRIPRLQCLCDGVRAHRDGPGAAFSSRHLLPKLRLRRFLQLQAIPEVLQLLR